MSKHKAEQRTNDFEHVLAEYLNEHKLEVKASTYARYVEIAERYLIPYLGLKAVAEFCLDDGNDYIRRLANEGRSGGGGLAPKSVKDIVSLLKLTLKYAERKGYIDKAPVDFTLPKQGRPQIQIFSPNEQSRLEAYVRMPDDTYKFGVYLCLYTGLRLGEICALQWEDVDCASSIISVNKTALRIKNMGGTDNHKTKVILSSPKTPSSARFIPLPKTLGAQLMKLKAEHSAGESCFVLTGTDKLIEPRNYYERYKGYLRACGLGSFTFHALRHTFATRCIEAGVDPKVLSELLGHSSVQITLDRYVHPSLETKRSCLERLFED